MRFLLGVVVGVVIGRPVLNVVNEHLTPPVRRKIIQGITSLSDRLNSYIENQEVSQ
jgi:hypothetical protein